MNEESLGIAVNQGHQAHRELERTEEAFATLKAEYVSAWEATSLRDADGRERLWQAVQIVGKVESHLKQLVANGRVAQGDIARLRSGKNSWLG